MDEKDIRAILLSQYEYLDPPSELKDEVMQKINLLKVAKFLFEHHTKVPLHILDATLRSEDNPSSSNAESDQDTDATSPSSDDSEDNVK